MVVSKWRWRSANASALLIPFVFSVDAAAAAECVNETLLGRGDPSPSRWEKEVLVVMLLDEESASAAAAAVVLPCELDGVGGARCGGDDPTPSLLLLPWETPEE